MPPADRIEELKKKFDENPRRYFAPLANEYRKSGDLDQAIAICRAHLPQQPGHMSGHIVYGQALFEHGEMDEARTVFQTALDLDPENLIALRHLGDIALRTGDAGAARSWYERVLETDPRNEEITAILAGLAPSGAPAAAPEPAPAIQPPSPLDDIAAELEGADDPQAVRLDEPADLAIEMIPAHEVEPPAAEPDAAKDDVELLDLDTGSFAAPPAPSGAAADSPPQAPAQPEPAAGGSDDLLDLEGAMFGPPSGDAGAATPASEGEPSGDLPPLEITTAALQTDEQQTERAGSEASMLDGLEPTHFDASAAAAGDAPLDGLESQYFEPPAAADADAHVDGLESQDFEPPAAGESEVLSDLEPQEFEPPAPEVQPPRISQAFPAVEEFAGASFDDEPADSSPLQDPPAAEPAQAFVTETMAELYVQQGFLDRAADVYRQLLAQRPGDEGLRDRFAALEARLTPATVAPTPADPAADEPATSEAPAAAPPAREAGPSIREFLGRFAARRPYQGVPYVPTPAASHPATPEVPEEDDATDAEAFAPAASAPVADEAPDEPRPAPVAPEGEPGPVSALFGALADPEDEASAARLAAAFAPDSDTDAPAAEPESWPELDEGSPSLAGSPAVPELPDLDEIPELSEPQDPAPEAEPTLLPATGRPARPAETELSLDRVFREPRPAGGARTSSGFSFDQFFSGSEQPAPSKPPEQGDAPAAGADDIAQFNAWLQGLKNK